MNLNLSLKAKLLALFLILGLVPLAIFGYFSLTQSGETARDKAKAHLVNVRELQASRIEGYLKELKDLITTKSRSTMTKQYMQGFAEAYQNLPDELENLRKENQQEIEQGITQRLRDQQDKTYQAPSDAVQRWYPQSTSGELLQHLYIADNPNPIGSKQNLDNAGDGSRWSELHSEFHPIMRDYLEKYGFYDIFLVEPDNGEVVYSVFKEVDLGTSMLNGPYANTAFGRVFKKARDKTDSDFVAIEDFDKFPPSFNTEQSFMATPIVEDDEVVGVLVFQMPIGEINSIMTNNQHWKEDGLKSTGESYLVSSDGTFRSAARPYLEDPDSFYDRLEQMGVDEQTTKAIRELETVIGFLPVNYPFFSQLFQGSDGVDFGAKGVSTHENYLGDNTITAWEPVSEPRDLAKELEWGVMVSKSTNEAYAEIHTMRWYLITGAIILALIVMVVAYYFSNAISSALNQVTARIRRIASGDLDQKQLNMDRSDEIGQLADSFDDMIENFTILGQQARAIADLRLNDQVLDQSVEGDLGEAFQDMVSELESVVRSLQGSVQKVTQVSEEVLTASDQLNRSSQELSEAAEEQSSSLQETSSQVEEMASMIQQSSDNAEESDRLAQEAANTAEEGQEVIDEMAATMEQINDESQRIEEAIEVIDDIAFQTNLLALNAAVEAANAGEHGAGFAVVADEVRELAQRSSEAAEEISEIIEESVERTTEGARHAESSQEVLSKINERVDEVAERMAEISSAADEQSKGVEEINQALQELEEVTEKNSSNAQETASSSNELTSQANSMEDVVQELQDMIERFQIDASDEQISGQSQSRPDTDSTPEVNPDQGAESSSIDSGTGDLESDEEENVIPLEDDKGDF